MWCQPQVTPEDIYRVMPLCLRHRLRKDPLETIDSGDKVQENFKVGAVPVSPASQTCQENAFCDCLMSCSVAKGNDRPALQRVFGY
jgi:AAA lid domain